MARFGSDFSRWGGPLLYRNAFQGSLLIGLGLALLLAVANIVLQGVAGMAILYLGFHSTISDSAALLKASIIGVFPSAVATFGLIWLLARAGGNDPVIVLSLRRPHLGWLGWICVLLGFLVVMDVAINVAMVVFHIDVTQFDPGPDGKSPSGQVDLVKQAMLEMSKSPMIYLLAIPAVTIGAPLAEETLFRGYLFTLIARSPLGTAGAVIITAAAWALMHKVTAPWFMVGVLFFMGLVLGLLLLRFGSLWVTMACHALWNAIFSLIMLSMPSS
jgi:membrane protease YdiL (CAAX protease family)